MSRKDGDPPRRGTRGPVAREGTKLLTCRIPLSLAREIDDACYALHIADDSKLVRRALMEFVERNRRAIDAHKAVQAQFNGRHDTEESSPGSEVHEKPFHDSRDSRPDEDRMEVHPRRVKRFS